MNKEIDPKVIAIYFPQFHPIPENDVWWGKGFNDWKLVENAKPLFAGHDQPKIPLDGMYNPCEKRVLKHQAELAKGYGIHAFMFYHYWFDGKLLLEKPLETLRDNLDIDINYCVCWANGTWTRAWEGKAEILIEQKHKNDPELWKAHFNYLLPFFKDKRALRKDGKPVFLVYQPNLLNNTKEMFEVWNKLAVQNGLPGLYIIAIKNYNFGNHIGFLNYYDGLMKFQPREAYTSKSFKENSTNRFQIVRRLPPVLLNKIKNVYLKFKSYSIINGDQIWSIILQYAFNNPYPQYDLDIYECGYLEWDNTSRYKNKSKIFTRPEKSHLEMYLSELFSKAKQNASDFIFWNAWNEWSEGTYLEPDTNRGYENLELLNNAINGIAMPNISVCMATRNGAKYIKQQIDSILPQLQENDELIISDDGSTDDTQSIIKQYRDPRIKLISQEREKQTYSSLTSRIKLNFENAIKHAKGRYIFLSDQDDVWMPNKVAISSKYLRDVDLVVSDAIVTDESLKEIYPTRFHKGCSQTKNLTKAYITTPPYQGSCMAFKREILKKALPIPDDVGTHDIWLGYIANRYFKARLIPEKLIKYRRHKEVASATGEKSPYSIVQRVRTRLIYLFRLIQRRNK